MSGVCLPLLKLLPSLRELDISGRQRTDSGLWGMALTDFNLDHIVQLEQLKSLNVGETAITDRGAGQLAAMRNLETLDLHGTSVTARGMAALVDMPNLRRLRLWRAKGIDDSAIPHFLKMKNLEVLELQETNVTDAGLEQLAGMTRLKRLYVGASKVTPGKVEALRKSSPDRLISWWPKPKEAASAESEDEER
jgi:Leucine-rich repeat (LRR) protein